MYLPNNIIHSVFRWLIHLEIFIGLPDGLCKGTNPRNNYDWVRDSKYVKLVLDIELKIAIAPHHKLLGKKKEE